MSKDIEVLAKMDELKTPKSEATHLRIHRFILSLVSH